MGQTMTKVKCSYCGKKFERRKTEVDYGLKKVASCIVHWRVMEIAVATFSIYIRYRSKHRNQKRTSIPRFDTCYVRLENEPKKTTASRVK